MSTVVAPTDTTALVISTEIILAEEKLFSVYQQQQPENITNTVDYENKKHIIHTADKLTTRDSNKKNPKINASEFQHWINSHGGEKNFSAFIKSSHATIVRRKKSILSRVSYSSSSEEEEESDSSSDDEDDDTEDFIPLSDLQQQQQQHKKQSSLPTPKPSRITRHNSNNVHKSNEKLKSDKLKKSKIVDMPTSKKSSSWFTGLFNKQTSTVKPSTTMNSPTNKKASNTLSGFFTLKKQQQQERKQALLKKKNNNIPSSQPILELPTRYPIPIERCIYQLSFMKLSNPKRPLRQQVLVSNMMHRYTNMIKNQVNTSKNKNKSVVLNSMIYQQNSNEFYIPPRSTSTSKRHIVGH